MSHQFVRVDSSNFDEYRYEGTPALLNGETVIKFWARFRLDDVAADSVLFTTNGNALTDVIYLMACDDASSGGHTDVLRLYLEQDVLTDYHVADGLLADTWYVLQVQIVFDGAGNLTVRSWIDGVETFTDINSATTAGVPNAYVAGAATFLQVGSGIAGLNGFNGQIEDLGIQVGTEWSAGELSRIAAGIGTADDKPILENLDSAANIAFYASYHTNANDLISGAPDATDGTPHRKWGAPIKYTGDKPVIAVMGDTQVMVQDSPAADMVLVQDWLENRLTQRKVAAVLHMGDWMDDPVDPQGANANRKSVV